MPLITPFDNPHSSEPLSAAWTWCKETSFDFARGKGRLVYEVYASREAAYSGKAPVQVVEVELGSPAEYGPAPLISPYVPPVYETQVVREPGANGPDDPGETASVEISPAQPPVYGPAPLLRPAVPTLAELVADNQEAYNALLSVVDALALTLPEFAGGEVEAV